MHAVNLGESAVRDERSNLRKRCYFDNGDEIERIHLATVIRRQ